MYCHGCYTSFDGGDHKPAFVISKEGSKEVNNLCTQCYERKQYESAANGMTSPTQATAIAQPPPYGGLRIGTKRIPLDKKYPGFYLAQFANPATGANGNLMDSDN